MCPRARRAVAEADAHRVRVDARVGVADAHAHRRAAVGERDLDGGRHAVDRQRRGRGERGLAVPVGGEHLQTMVTGAQTARDPGARRGPLRPPGWAGCDRRARGGRSTARRRWERAARRRAPARASPTLWAASARTGRAARSPAPRRSRRCRTAPGGRRSGRRRAPSARPRVRATSPPAPPLTSAVCTAPPGKSSRTATAGWPCASALGHAETPPPSGFITLATPCSPPANGGPSESAPVSPLSLPSITRGVPLSS